MKTKEPKVLKNLQEFIFEARHRLEHHMNQEWQHYVGSLIVKGIIKAPDSGAALKLDHNDFCDFMTDFFEEYINMMKLWKRVDPVITKMAVMPKNDLSKSHDDVKPVIMN
jgi:hypothetical protein